jgi:adenosine deaminase
MIDAGLSVSVSTDNRLMSGVTMSGEMATVHRELGLDLATLVALNRAAAQASFLPAAQRDAALAAIDAWAAAHA